LPSYRPYRLDGAGKITTAEWIDAASDKEAVSASEARCSAGKYELWDRRRLVARIAREDS
jgi:hypothetical protein